MIEWLRFVVIGCKFNSKILVPHLRLGFQLAALPALPAQEAADDEVCIFHNSDTRGTGGKPIQAEANYIKLETVMGVVINEFVVRFDPPMDSRLAFSAAIRMVCL